jgi:uncharacterized protein
MQCLRQRSICIRPIVVVRGTPCQSLRRAHPRSVRPLCPRWNQRRHSSLGGVLGTVLLPPAVFTGLLITLWAYKCLMMVVFQNKIIYMPSVPPFSRSEKLDDYAVRCKPVVWREHAIKSGDGTLIKLLEGEQNVVGQQQQSKLVVVYFQGNASSLPPRLPFLSDIVKSAATATSDPVSISVVALSYRGFWTSRGSPTQPGLELDAQAALEWTLDRYGADTKILVWGQSIGSGVAALATARLLRDQTGRLDRLAGLLLETPFVNLRALLIGLYPQKWLPYRYLAPFLRSTWETARALEDVDNSKTRMKIMLLEAENDEIVPSGQAEALEAVCRNAGLWVKRETVRGALHQDIVLKPIGRRHIVDFITRIAGGH